MPTNSKSIDMYKLKTNSLHSQDQWKNATACIFTLYSNCI